MKRTAKMIIAIMMIAAIVLTSIGGNVKEVNAKSSYTSTVTKFLKAYKAKNYKKASKLAKKMTKDKDTSYKKMSKKQKAAYKKIVKKYNLETRLGKDYLWGYYLVDLDQDKKPELLCKYGTCEADVRTDIYTFKKGKAKKVRTAYSGHVGYVAYPGKGVMQVWSHMGYASVSVMKMKYGKITSTGYGDLKFTNKTNGVLSMKFLNGHISYSYSNKKYTRTLDLSELK